MIAERLKELRKAAHETQAQTAAACGIYQVSYSRYQTGARIPDPTYLKKLAEHFNVSVDYLLGGSDIPTSQEESVRTEGKENPPPQFMAMDEFDQLYLSLTPEEKEALTAVLRCIRQASGK